MAEYIITGPDGSEYEISGNGTEQEAMNAFFEQYSAQMSPQDQQDYRIKNRDAFADFLMKKATAAKPGETPEQTDQRNALGSGQAMQGASPMLSGVAGAADTLSWGFGDELAAGVDAATSNRTYDQSLDLQRRFADTAQADNPKSYLTGQIAGAIAPALVTGGSSSAPTLGGKAVQGGAMGAVQGGTYGFGSGEGGAENRLKSAAEGAAWGGALGAAGPYIAKGAGKAYEAIAGKKPYVPTNADLKAMSQQAARQADQIGLEVSPQGVDDIRNGIYNAMGTDFFPENMPQLANALKAIDSRAGAPMKLDELRAIRTKLKSAYSPANPNQNRVMDNAVRALDDAIENINPAQVTSGNPVAASMLLKSHRADWAKYRTSEMMQNIIENAKNAQGANYTNAGFLTSVKQQLRSIAKDNFKNHKYLAPDVKEMITDLVQSRGAMRKTENILRKLGKFSITNQLSMATVPGGAYALNHLIPGAGVPAGIALVTAGTAAKPISEKMGLSAINAIDEAIRAGGKVVKTAPGTAAVENVTGKALSGLPTLGGGIGSPFAPFGPPPLPPGNPNNNRLQYR